MQGIETVTGCYTVLHSTEGKEKGWIYREQQASRWSLLPEVASLRCGGWFQSGATPRPACVVNTSTFRVQTFSSVWKSAFKITSIIRYEPNGASCHKSSRGGENKHDFGLEIKCFNTYFALLEELYKTTQSHALNVARAIMPHTPRVGETRISALGCV
jgi:hypothetical protein